MTVQFCPPRLLPQSMSSWPVQGPRSLMLTMFYWNYLDAAVLMPGTFYHGWRKKFYTFNLLNCLILLNTCANVHKRCPYLTLQSYTWLKLGLGMSVVHRLDNERVCILIKWLSSQRLAWSDPLQWVLLQNLAQGFLNLILPQNHQLSLLKMEFLGPPPTSRFWFGMTGESPQETAHVARAQLLPMKTVQREL